MQNCHCHQMVPGVNLGYKVQLWKGPPGTNQPTRMERLFPALGRIEQVIGRLEKYGSYNLTVLCFTAPGDGPRSEPVEFRTAEDLPGPVSRKLKFSNKISFRFKRWKWLKCFLSLHSSNGSLPLRQMANCRSTCLAGGKLPTQTAKADKPWH